MTKREFFPPAAFSSLCVYYRGICFDDNDDDKRQIKMNTTRICLYCVSVVDYKKKHFNHSLVSLFSLSHIFSCICAPQTLLSMRTLIFTALFLTYSKTQCNILRNKEGTNCHKRIKNIKQVLSSTTVVQHEREEKGNQIKPTTTFYRTIIIIREEKTRKKIKNRI